MNSLDLMGAEAIDLNGVYIKADELLEWHRRLNGNLVVDDGLIARLKRIYKAFESKNGRPPQAIKRIPEYPEYWFVPQRWATYNEVIDGGTKTPSPIVVLLFFAVRKVF